MEGRGRTSGQLRQRPRRLPPGATRQRHRRRHQSVPVTEPHSVQARARLRSPPRSAETATRWKDAAGRLLNSKQRHPGRSDRGNEHRALRDNETRQKTATAEDSNPDDVSAKDEVPCHPRHPQPAPCRSDAACLRGPPRSLNASARDLCGVSPGSVTHLGKVHQGVGLVTQLPLLHLDAPQSVGKVDRHTRRARPRTSPTNRFPVRSSGDEAPLGTATVGDGRPESRAGQAPREHTRAHSPASSPPRAPGLTPRPSPSGPPNLPARINVPTPPLPHALKILLWKVLNSLFCFRL